MPRLRSFFAPAAVSAGVLLCVSTAVSAPDSTPKPGVSGSTLVSLDEARRMVRMMDDIYVAATLTTHKMYVQDPGTPAAVTWAKQVIAQVRGRGWPEARIFDTTGRPLNPENSISSDFERRAAAAFRSGKPAFEQVTGRTLRYATPLRIADRSCLTCHVKNKVGVLLGGIAYEIRVNSGGVSRGSAR